MKKKIAVLLLAGAMTASLAVNVAAEATVAEDAGEYENLDGEFEDLGELYTEEELLEELYLTGEDEEYTDEEYYDYYDYDDEPVVSDKLVPYEMSDPFGGDPVEVMVWDGVDADASSEESGYSYVSTNANNVTINYEITEGTDEPVDLLKSELTLRGGLNLGYSAIEITNLRKSGDQAWGLMSFSGKGMSAYKDLVVIRRVSDQAFLTCVVEYAAGMDIYGADYTPDDAVLEMVSEALGVRETDGEENGLSAEELIPVANLHEYSFTDSVVGEKAFYVWEDEPYMMTASDYSDYGFYDEESFSTAEEGEEEDAGSEVEDAAAEEDPFVAYCTTQAKGVFASMEMYRNDDPAIAETLIEQYIENLSYYGAVRLMRSELKTEGNATWVCSSFSDEEADEAYQGLRTIYAVLVDADTYTTVEAFIPSDADAAVLEDFLKAYGLTMEETGIEIEQETYDFDYSDYEDYGFELSDSMAEEYAGIELDPDFLIEEDAVG